MSQPLIYCENTPSAASKDGRQVSLNCAGSKLGHKPILNSYLITFCFSMLLLASTLNSFLPTSRSSEKCALVNGLVLHITHFCRSFIDSKRQEWHRRKQQHFVRQLRLSSPSFIADLLSVDQHQQHSTGFSTNLNCLMSVILENNLK